MPNPVTPVERLLRRADALILVPPFTRLLMPHLGAHVLQACARERGHDVVVLYAGMLMAAEGGLAIYQDLSDCATPLMLGERVFCRAAYGLPHLGREPHHELRRALATTHVGSPVISYEALQELSRFAVDWVDRLGAAIASSAIPVVGATTVFEQTAAAVALLDAVKRHRPGTTTVIGGANCAGPMATGIASLPTTIDTIFAGESEEVFPDFLDAVRDGRRPGERIIEGLPCTRMDALPTPDFGDFYRQWEAWIGDAVDARESCLPYESSRGCWWGQKHHCTFCGVQNMAFREKSADRVIGELRSLLRVHPSRKVRNADDIMPATYFRTLIPRLPEEVPGLEMFYEQKANLTLERVRALRRAGVTSIQPGIEALSTPLLRRMRKGIEAHRNLALMRYASATCVSLTWNLLYGFPGDSAADYEHYLTLLPLIRHLQPPQGFGPVFVIRFSPYFKESAEYGIADLRPAAVYDEILPGGADVRSLAYYFDARYDSVATSSPELMDAIAQEVDRWRLAWRSKNVPLLKVLVPEPDVYVLADTRGIEGFPEIEILSAARAETILTPRRVGAEVTDDLRWALERGLVFALDGWYAPLATAAPEVLAAFERSDLAAARPAARAIA